MAKKINGVARWVIVSLGLLTIAFNTGVTYNHIHNLSKGMEKLTETVEKLDDAIDEIRIEMAKNE